MIECAHCETAQFLQIVESRVLYADGKSVSELEERYECTMCGASGQVKSKDRTTVLDGEINETDAIEVWP